MSGTKIGEQNARLAGVQALYQMEIANTSLRAVLADARADHLGVSSDEAAGDDLDLDLFDRIVSGVVEHQEAIDVTLSAHLASHWRIERLASVTRAILRLAIFELQFDWRADAPLIIDIYVSLTRSFFDDPEPGFVNGLLDQIAKGLRAHA